MKSGRNASRGTDNVAIQCVPSSKRLSRSNAWLPHIENDRADVPSDGRLTALLNLYGLKAEALMRERERGQKAAQSTCIGRRLRLKNELHDLIDRLDADKVRLAQLHGHRDPQKRRCVYFGESANMGGVLLLMKLQE